MPRFQGSVEASPNIDIETISAEALGEKGPISLTADGHDGALRVLTDAGFKTVSDESLILRLQDEPGALAGLAERFKQAGVSIRSLHKLDRQNGYATVAISADDRAKAEALVEPETAVSEVSDGAQVVKQCEVLIDPPGRSAIRQTMQRLRRDSAGPSTLCSP